VLSASAASRSSPTRQSTLIAEPVEQRPCVDVGLGDGALSEKIRKQGEGPLVLSGAAFRQMTPIAAIMNTTHAAQGALITVFSVPVRSTRY
jgi:hypothetical protein